MLAITSLLIIIVFSLIAARVGAVALRITGISDDTARFQAISALTGAGFTTAESEQVVTHPVRRRIVSTLMLVGNVGIVAASGTLIVSLMQIESRSDAWRLVLLAVALIALYIFASSRAIDRIMCAMIARGFMRYSNLETRDFATLLHLQGDFRIAEIFVEDTNWMTGKTLAEIRSEHRDVLILGVSHPKTGYEGAPGGHFRVKAGQTLVAYGLPEPVELLDCRCGHKNNSRD